MGSIISKHPVALIYHFSFSISGHHCAIRNPFLLTLVFIHHNILTFLTIGSICTFLACAKNVPRIPCIKSILHILTGRPTDSSFRLGFWFSVQRAGECGHQRRGADTHLRHHCRHSSPWQHWVPGKKKINKIWDLCINFIIVSMYSVSTNYRASVEGWREHGSNLARLESASELKKPQTLKQTAL